MKAGTELNPQKPEDLEVYFNGVVRNVFGNAEVLQTSIRSQLSHLRSNAFSPSGGAGATTVLVCLYICM